MAGAWSFSRPGGRVTLYSGKNFNAIRMRPSDRQCGHFAGRHRKFRIATNRTEGVNIATGDKKEGLLPRERPSDVLGRPFAAARTHYGVWSDVLSQDRGWIDTN